MGSEDFPEEDAYSGFISENGGFCNACTTMENTNYVFEVSYDGLQEALRRMASNFKSPLLKKEAIRREVHSIESEF